MSLAIEFAIENVESGSGGPFGAVVARNGEVLSTGVNQVTKLNDPTAHAEIVAIRAACERLGSFQLTGCEVFASCEPCPMCLAAVYWARPDALYYAATQIEAAHAGFDDAQIYRELSLPPIKRALPTFCLADDRAQAPFARWAAAVDKIRY